jgi:hypothetical protein
LEHEHGPPQRRGNEPNWAAKPPPVPPTVGRRPTTLVGSRWAGVKQLRGHLLASLVDAGSDVRQHRQTRGRQDGIEAAIAEFRAEVEHLEGLPVIQLGSEVMFKGFGRGGYLPDFVQRKPYAVACALVRNIADMFQPSGARDADVGGEPRLRLMLWSGACTGVSVEYA